MPLDRLHAIEVFIAVADAGSFAKGGARLRLSPPAVSRAIAALEDRLGARLFNRTTRSLTITDVGRRFLESARRLLADLDTAEKQAVGEPTTPRGHLAITAPVTLGRSALPPVVCDFLRDHPRVTASILLRDRVVSLVEEGIDVALRIGRLPDSSLIAKRVGTVRRVLVASPDYLARRGTPASPADLREHSLIAFTGLLPNREWRFFDGRKAIGVPLRPALEIDDAGATILAAETGYGITVALSYMVSDRLRAGRLVAILDGFAPTARPVHLVYPRARLVAPQVRAFIDVAAPRLKAALDAAWCSGTNDAPPGRVRDDEERTS